MEKNKIMKVNLVYFATVMLYISTSLIDFSFIKDRYILMIISQAVLFLPAVVYLIVEKIPIKETFRMNRIKNINILLLVILAFTISPVLTFINSLSMLFAENRASTTIIEIVSENPLLLSAVVVALLPALLEEMAYRGLYYNSYKGGGILKAIVLSSGMFALLHGNFNQFSYTIMIGMLFAFIVEATGSIISSIIMHFIINVSSVIQVYFLPTLMMLLEYTYYEAVDSGNKEMTDLVENLVGGKEFNLESMLEQSMESIKSLTLTDVVSNYLPSAVIGGLISYFIFKKIAKNENRWEHIQGIFRRKSLDSIEACEKTSWSQLFSIPLIAAMIIMLTLMIVLEFM